MAQWTEAHYALALLAFAGIYTFVVAISVPGAVILTLLGGYLFGIVAGTLIVVLSATAGACLLFIATKTAFKEILSKKAGPSVKKMEAGFQENALSYLLFLRLVPLFPFWLVNIVPALLDIPLRTFALGTSLGIIPGTFVYVLIGNGLHHLFEQNKTPNLSIIFEPNILAPLIGLSLLSVTPILYKKLKKNK